MAGRLMVITIICGIALSVSTYAQTDRVDITVKEPSSSITTPEPLSCEILANSSTVMCDNLDEAIRYTLSVTAANQTVVYILIPAGIHSLTTQTNFGDGDVHFLGTDSDVKVFCDYYADPDTNDIAEIHTWYFNQSRDIRFENIHFSDCGFPFRLFSVMEVNVYNCNFTNFSEAVLDIFNCVNVTLDRTSLINNSGFGRVMESLRGNSGGIAVGYNKLDASVATKPTLTISNCNFIGNRAMGDLSPERAVADQLFIGRGGGLGIYMNVSRHELLIRVTDCLFENNLARLFGGGIYLISTSYDIVQHIMEVTNTRFVGNVALEGGAGIQFSFLSSGNSSRPNRFIITDCLFQGNRGSSGGGVYVFLESDGNFIQMNRCNFINNTGLGTQVDLGAAVALTYLLRFTQTVTSTHQEIVNCSFVRNTSPNGIVSVGYTPLRFYGTNSFRENVGASLRVTGSLVDLEGEMEFKHNLVSDEEGCLYLLSLGQIRLSKGTHLIFDGNVGRLGSSIVVQTPAILTAASNLPYNPRCFIQYEDDEVTPLEWEDVKVTFRDNRAIVSSAVYLSQSVGNACSWFKQNPPFFNSSFTPDWPIWLYDNNSNTGYYDSQNQEFSFGTTAQGFSLQASDIYAWPGQNIEVNLLVQDQYRHRTSSSTRFTFIPNQEYHQNISSDSVRFNSQIKILASSEESNGLLEETFNFSYSLSSPSIQPSTAGQVSLGLVKVEEAFQNSGTSVNFTLHAVPCPGGYSFTVSPNTGATEYKCTCIDTIREIVFCEDDQDAVILQYGTWALYNPPADSSDVNLFFHSCPAGYCSCSFNSRTLGDNSAGKMCVYQYRHSNPDQQCVCEREGILCGRCKNNTTGVSVLLNKCVSCSQGFLALIPLMVAIIVVVIVIVIMVDKPLPEWTIPFLFYIQNAPYAALFFPDTFNSLGKYLYYFSSATGFYFVYDFCLSSNLSSVHSYLLRYIPAFTALVVYFFIWLIRRKILKKKTMDNYGSWWCILLMYSSVAYTSMSALHCLSIPTNSSSKDYWFVSGDTECFVGDHIPLGLLAVVMLIACVFFAVLVTIVPLMKISLFKNYLKPFSVSYKDDMKYWSGIELARRFLFLLALVPFPRNTVYAILLLIVSMCLYFYYLPYKTIATNVFEIFLQLNFLALLLLETMPIVKDELFVFAPQTSVGTCSNSFSEVSYITILLIPIYYTPICLLIVVAVVYLILHLIKRWRTKAENEKVLVRLHSECVRVVASDFTTQSINIDYNMEDFPLAI